ncbi:MAG: zf-HC2 domain-containing protein [Candidatus Doudnabacteria bacterium]
MKEEFKMECVWGDLNQSLLRKFARGLDDRIDDERLAELKQHLQECAECRNFVAENDQPFEYNPKDPEYDSDEAQALRSSYDGFHRTFGKADPNGDPFD